MTVFSPLENINAKSVIYSDSTIIIQTRPYNIDFLKTMSTKSMQTLLGRKLSFKEKAGLFFLKNSKKNKVYAGNDEEVKSKKGTWSLILGISSFLLLGPLGAIPAIILGAQALKENPNDSNARAGKILGIVYLALSVVAILLLIAVYSGAWI
jgi:hypothetical protein